LKFSIIHSFGISKLGPQICQLNTKFENFIIEFDDMLAEAGIIFLGLIEGESQVRVLFAEASLFTGREVVDVCG
jgi:hypothetical protein